MHDDGVPAPLILLSKSEVEELLTLDDCIAAVEEAFAAHAKGMAIGPSSLSVHVPGGAFHVKAAAIGKSFAVKINANFFANPDRGLPRIQGVIGLCDAERGTPLALMDSVAITVLRTGAATAVAAKYLAPAGAKSLLIAGCGNQGRISIEAISRVIPVGRVLLFDVNMGQSQSLAEALAGAGTKAEVIEDFTSAISQSDICVTSTPSRTHFVDAAHAHPGLFIAAVGADSREKQEIDPQLLARSRVVVDDLEQCASFGDLRYALESGVMSRDDVAATLGEVITGQKAGRARGDEVVIFDSTGTALQDVAAAHLVYQRALERNVGVRFSLTA
jgi:alanine dehydrogenase